MNPIFWLIFLPAVVADKITCRNEKGLPVDWYYLYKMPKNFEILQNFVDKGADSSGTLYAFISSEDDSNWYLSKMHINQSTSFPGQTLNLIYKNGSDFMAFFYNDENPNGTVSFIEGHTKGVVAANTQTGFWLIHSVPKFPNTANYDYPHNGQHYGQSFLCITLPADEINRVGEQLLFNEPTIYYERFPHTMKKTFPIFDQVLQKKWKSFGTGPFSNEVQLTSFGGVKFRSFAKGRNFDKDLYEDFVAPKLNVNLMVESWRLGTGDLPSDCKTKYHVYNVKEISMSNFNVNFKSTSDHSKWAVSDMEQWTCIGDINRQEHQLKRGGGTVCQFNTNLSKLYKNLITTIEPCSKHK